MRFSASAARVLTGCVGSCPVASLYSNSAAEAGCVRMPTNGIAAPAARTARRVRPRLLEVLMISSSFPLLGRNDPKLRSSPVRLGRVLLFVALIERLVSPDDLAIV